MEKARLRLGLQTLIESGDGRKEKKIEYDLGFFFNI